MATFAATPVRRNLLHLARGKLLLLPHSLMFITSSDQKKERNKEERKKRQ